ncbi:MAG: MoaD/ThiS family protein [Fidelibacterota bacterium]|jgi:molybdopterin converting factor small subunit|nr:MoaD/ThiS family protein [Candidatus Neomarinimicrobiota bacterium]|tara:strand:+ start:2724 stop:2969 length:246 start_codon:yes stop_codon:yes gene_type:complete
MINVKVKCFSQVKYALGVDVLTFELDENTTSIDLEKIIRKKAGKKLNNVPLRIAINQKYQKEETILQDADEVVFIPPVQGG